MSIRSRFFAQLAAPVDRALSFLGEELLGPDLFDVEQGRFGERLRLMEESRGLRRLRSAAPDGAAAGR